MKFRFALFTFFLFVTNIFSAPYTGWEIGNNHSVLYINDLSVFDTRDTIRYLPQKLNSDQIQQYATYIAEYYISRGDKDGLANLANLLKSDRSNSYEFIANLILVFWKIEKAETNDALFKLDEIIAKEENPLHQSIAKVVKSNLKKISIPADTKDVIKNLNCSRSKPMYSFCRLIKVSVHLEHLAETSDYPHRDYLNLDRLLAPFFEEYELAHVSFLEKFTFEMPSKLAYLGFAYEAVHFQKMVVNLQKISGAFDPTEHERLSFYQMLNDDLTSAEEALSYSSKKTSAITSNKNPIFLKLGAIAFLRKDYKQSMNYYLELNLKEWNKSIKNPFYDDSISINGARGLISLSLWKSKSAVNAVRALNKLNTDNTITEESLFLRLRIAQIMMAEKPEMAEKISEDIMYIAQGKGWKRVEYAATIMNGYCSIISKKYRKATVQFTKSYGILGGSDPAFTSEWMRSSGMLIARVQGGERGNHAVSFRSLLNSMRNEEPLDDILSVKNFLDSRFDTEAFFKTAVNYFTYTKNYQSLIEFLFHYQKMKFKSSSIVGKTILQLPDVNKRMKHYRSFRPSSDYHYVRSIYSKLREAESSKMSSDSDLFDVNSLKDIRDPFVAAFSFNEKIYVISYNPESRDKWSISLHNSIDYRTTGYYNKIFSNIPFLDKAGNIQIFMNPLGVDLYQAMKKNNALLNLRLFYRFNKGNLKSEGDLQPVAVSCDSGNEVVTNGIQYLPAEYFEGTKTFSNDQRLHIWTTKDLGNRDVSSIENFEWRCQNNSTISFSKLRRRVDLRMIPNAILFSNSIFPKSSLDSISLDYYFWADFWMQKGANTLYYVDRLEGDKYSFTDLVNVLTKVSQGFDDPAKIQSTLKSSDKEILILTRDMR
ncbi:MAG TPA: hypothetical protein PK079_09595 [Leptospiraceae bacterium]|nr:hypothetical protein [Leptospiraceae bacterium]HMW04559.1 hypothetical protein [Leptospiraceae bacterium]HMX33446.1 hypothetical protein [Leptospiraceae bacterium]HMY30745.1 hypothetical protein [Leptospiraceae bacterium]HMZ64323.1 hypothetical protein [Leptospiraceae bacterium]